MAEHQAAGGWVEGSAGGRECTCGFTVGWSGEDPESDAQVRQLFDEHIREHAEPDADAVDELTEVEQAGVLAWIEATAASYERACAGHVLKSSYAEAGIQARFAAELRSHALILRSQEETEKPPAAATAEGEH